MKCVWTRDEETYAFATSCGHLWEIYDGSLKENCINYCPICGKEALEVEEDQ